MGNSHINIPVETYTMELDHIPTFYDIDNATKLNFYTIKYPVDKYRYSYEFHEFENSIIIRIYDRKTYKRPDW